MSLKPHHSVWIQLLILAVLWVAAFLIVNPLRYFPLNDDWSYAYSVRILVEEGRYVLNDWLAMPLFTQVMWGGLFCLPFGFSFTALTMSTLTLGLIGVIFSYLVIRLVTKDSMMAFMTGLLVAFNPLYFSLSVTFMSDIHYYAFFIVAFYFYIRHLQEKKWRFWIWGTLFTVLAMMVRQISVALPLAFLIYYLLYYKTSGKRIIGFYLFSAVLVMAIYFAYGQFLHMNDNVPEYYRRISDIGEIGIEEMGWSLFTRVGMILLYTGLWLFPLLLVMFIGDYKKIIRQYKFLLLPVMLFLVPIIRMVGELPHGNNLYDLGLGPVTTADVYIYGAEIPFRSIPVIWYVVRPIAFTGAVMFVILAMMKLRSFYLSRKEGKPTETENINLIGLLVLFISLGPIMINYTYFDRYVISLLIPALLFVFPAPGPKYEGKIYPSKWVFAAFMIGMAYFSITATKTYLDWNRARWDLAEKLVATGIDASAIDGGHEFNGWHGDQIYRDGKWDVTNKVYVIGFSKIEGFIITSESSVFNYVTWEEVPIFTLRKIP